MNGELFYRRFPFLEEAMYNMSLEKNDKRIKNMENVKKVVYCFNKMASHFSAERRCRRRIRAFSYR